MSRNPANRQLLEGASDLGWRQRLDTARVVLLRRGHEMIRLVGIKLQRPAMAPKIPIQHSHVFFGRITASESRKRSTCRVIDHLNEVDSLAPPFQPIVVAGIPLHQFSESLASRSPP